jgi:Protein of unknown function (DUF2934)
VNPVAFVQYIMQLVQAGQFLPYLKQHGFPGLSLQGCAVTSPADLNYNCIAWAVGDTTNWWWPTGSRQRYWPPGVAEQETIQVFIQVFEGLGYMQCDSPMHEPAIEKIAIYALNNKPTHASRQLLNGNWTSKLGPACDISHTPTCLNGPRYGTVVVYMRRGRPHHFAASVIAPIAFAIWEREGKQQGDHERHWMMAIQQLLEEEGQPQ